MGKSSHHASVMKSFPYSCKILSPFEFWCWNEAYNPRFLIDSFYGQNCALKILVHTQIFTRTNPFELKLNCSYWGVFRIQSKIWDGALNVNYYRKTLHFRCLIGIWIRLLATLYPKYIFNLYLQFYIVYFCVLINLVIVTLIQV